MLPTLSRHDVIRFALACASFCMLSACETSPSAPRAPYTGPVSLTILGGNNQVAPIRTLLAKPLSAKVVDSVGNPVEGRVVNFVVTDGGGSVFAGSSISNADGIVKERWTLGGVPQSQQHVEARGVDNVTGKVIKYATYTATATMPAGVTKVWIGSDNIWGDWKQAVNWYPASIPKNSDDVRIVGGQPTQPFIALNGCGTCIAYTRNLVVDSSASIAGDNTNVMYAYGPATIYGRIAGFDLLVFGSVDVPGDATGLRNLSLGTPNTSIRGKLPQTHVDVPGVFLSGDVYSPSYMLISTDLNVSGHVLQAGAVIGTLKMSAAADDVVVNQLSSAPGAEITAGRLFVRVASSTSLGDDMDGTNTVFLLDSAQVSGSAAFMQNLESRGDSTSTQVNITVRHDFRLRTGKFNNNSTMLVKGNLTLDPGTTLINTGTMTYKGTFTSAGSTIIGNSPVFSP